MSTPDQALPASPPGDADAGAEPRSLRAGSYLVLARKYRPQSFEDLVGQDHVARTLANAIAGGRVAHAFLFTGVRGVGKTTSARLLAKCLNCVGADGKSTGPTSKPCQVCGPCKEIAAGVDMDVQEIDGASYNGVDEVRRLQEGIAFRPARDRFKIYIVDEVHMLSNAAWNAFLKTLEEPPPHVKFIFATTEVHKVPVTILSRCQRYDFKLIPTQVIAARLAEVLKLEHIEADGAAVAVLSREAAGSMRDAMSLVDQVIAFSGNALAGADVARVLGVADRAILHELAAALVGGDAARCLDVVHRLSEQGFDLTNVAKDVLRHLRNLVVAKVCGDAERSRELLDLADEEAADVRELAARADADDLTRLFQGFSRGFDDIKESGQPRATLEMTLVRLARRPPLLPLDELLSRLGELEKRLQGGAPPPPRGGGPAGPGGGSRAPQGEGAPTLRAAPSALSVPSPPLPPPADVTSAAVPLRAREQNATRGSLALAAPAWIPESPPQPAAPPVSSVPSPARRSTPPEAAAPPPAPAPSPADLEAWRQIVARVRASRAALASVLEHGMPLEVTAQRVRVGYDAKSGFLSDQAKEPDALDLLTREVRAHFGAPTEVALDLAAPVAARVQTVAEIDAAKRRADVAKARAAVQAHPLVEEAVRLFSAEIREIKLPAGDD